MTRKNRKSPLPSEGLEKDILESLRRITRAIDLSSQRLRQQHGITTPQLICMSALQASGRMSFSQLSKKVYLTSSTLTSIVDRLEKKGYVKRVRDDQDRRVIFLILTPEGKKVVEETPSPLQQTLIDGLADLSDREKSGIRKALDRLVSLMEAGGLEAAPILEVGTLQDSKDKGKKPSNP